MEVGAAQSHHRSTLWRQPQPPTDLVSVYTVSIPPIFVKCNLVVFVKISGSAKQVVKIRTLATLDVLAAIKACYNYCLCLFKTHVVEVAAVSAAQGSNPASLFWWLRLQQLPSVSVFVFIILSVLYCRSDDDVISCIASIVRITRKLVCSLNKNADVSLDFWSGVSH